jgi:predicted permease
MPKGPVWREEVRERLKGLNLSPAREAEIVEELAQHLEENYRRLLAGGTTADEAYAMVIEEFCDGSFSAAPAVLSEHLQRVEQAAGPDPALLGDAHRSNFFGGLWQDLRYALRMFKRNPGFTALAVLSLALGIGGTAAIFSVVSAVLIRPLPYRDSNRLVAAANDGYYPPGGLVALQQESRTMELAGVNRAGDLNLTGQRDPWRLTGSSVSANFFTVLGVGAQMGRTFQAGDDQAGRDNLVILSHALWQNQFAGDPLAVGRVIALGGVDRRVIGVMPRTFAFPDAATQFWIPLHLDPRDPAGYWAFGFMPVFGRLRDGVTLEQARTEIQSLTHQMVGKFPYAMPKDWNVAITVRPLQEMMVAGVRDKLLVLQWAIALVLLIACVNVAGLLLARAAARQKEIAIRSALGAARGRITRQLLTESVTLAVAGGTLGIGLAVAAFSLLKNILTAGASDLSNINLGWQVVLFATTLSVLSGLAFGLAPALSASRHDLAATIKAGGQRSAGSARTRVRSVLIASEVALAVVLAVGAGLLIKSLWRLVQVNPGFRPEQIVTLRISPDPALCRQRAACIAFFDELLRRTREIPGVHDAAAANTVPLAGNIPSIPVAVEGHPQIPGVTLDPMFWFGAVSTQYFRLMQIPMVAGRAFSDADGEAAPRVVIVSAATARRYWPAENPIGKHLRPVFESRWRTVIGVAADVRQYDLANHSPDYIRGAMYMPYGQSVGNDRQLPATMTLLVRAESDRVASDTAALAGQVRDVAKGLNPNVPVSEIRTMSSMVDASTQQPRSMAWLFVTFAAAAILLAAIGTYGVVSYSTTQRTFEIGVRLALGASRRAVFGMVLGQGLRLVIAGLAVGVAMSLVLARMLAAFLYATASSDPVTFAVVSAVLLAVALLAGYLPARRAAHIDPLAALRVD